MPAYIHGNLALEERSSRKVKVKEKVVVRRRSIPVQEKLLYLFTIIVCVIVAGAIIWRYSQIYEMSNKIQQIEREMKVLQVENNKLKLEIGKLSSPERFQKEAVKFGLAPHEKQVNQVVQGNATAPRQSASAATP